MKKHVIPVVALIVLVAALVFYVSYPWSRDLTVSPSAQQNETCLVLYTYRDPNTGELRESVGVMDSPEHIVALTPATLLTFSAWERESVESFARSQGFSTLEAYVSANPFVAQSEPFGWSTFPLNPASTPLPARPSTGSTKGELP